MGEPKPARAEVAFLLSRVMEAVHAYNVDNGNALAVAFPAIRMRPSEEGLPFPGDVVRVFSEERHMAAFLGADRIRMLVAGGAFAQPPALREVPASDGFVTFRRSRLSEKLAPGHVLRSERRLRRRIAEGKCELSEGQLADRRANALKRCAKAAMPPFIHMKSGSTGGAFRLFIETEEASGPGAGRFSSYGLAIDGSAVPRFA